MHRRGLHKRTVHRWHGLTAILTMVMMRRAMHCMAALHCLFWRRRGTAVECVRGQSDREYHSKHWRNQPHCLLA
jgi:hypothetical protein